MEDPTTSTSSIKYEYSKPRVLPHWQVSIFLKHARWQLDVNMQEIEIERNKRHNV